MFTEINVNLTLPNDQAAHVRRSLNELLDYLTLRHTFILDSHVTATLVSSPRDADWEKLLAQERGCKS